ncbi:kinesin light chain protein [Verticillium dahliae]
MLDARNYTIGWIYAVECEFVAARAFLSKTHEGPIYLGIHDKNEYALGEMAGHNIVITVLPRDNYGICQATVAAASMVYSFPNVRIGLMVGIGGGVPSARNDIRLGAVVVGVPQGSHSAVLQYDLGKMAQGEAFETRSHLNKAPSLLRSAVQKLEARYHFDGVHLLDAVEKAAQKIEDGDYYRRPPITSDRLFRSSFTHPSSKPSLPCSQVCKGTSHLQARRARSGRPGDPFVHYGLIASGNLRISSALRRKRQAWWIRSPVLLSAESVTIQTHTKLTSGKVSRR